MTSVSTNTTASMVTTSSQATWSWYSLSSYIWPTSEEESIAAESRLLSRIPGFIPPGASAPIDEKSPIRASVRQVPIGSDQFINTLSITPRDQTNKKTDTSQTKTLVITHGYGAGLAYFYRNLGPLATALPGWDVHAIDWLGMGRSARVPFPKRENLSEAEFVDVVETFFLDSLDRWREAQGIEKMVLAGHSLGGYLSTAYALRYPERVERLILISPVGIPENPTAREHAEALKEASAGLEGEIAASDAEALTNANTTDTTDPAAGLPAPPNEFRPNSSDKRRRKLPGWVVSAWDSNYTPQWVIRFVGPFGPRLVRSYVQRRMYHLSEEERLDLQQYIYHISSAPGSGEYSLSALLAPGAHARRPLKDRLPGITMPTTFIYGDRDWMDYRHAVRVQPHMKVETNVVCIADSGHHMYLEQPEEFLQAMVDEINKVERG